MTTAGFFQQQVCPNFRIWVSDENIKYIQQQVSKRLADIYIEPIKLDYDRARSMLIHTIQTWRGPQTLDELLEMVITDFVTDINTDIEWRTRFNAYEPRTLYFPGTDLTREDKVKLKPGYKLEFQMNY